MCPSDCGSCEFALQCPVEKSGGRYVLHHTPAQRRLAARRAEQTTDEFNENYAIRGGIESTNSGIKRKTGLGRLRVRGRPRVQMSVQLKCAGWNILRALSIMKMRGIRDIPAAVASYCVLILDFCQHGVYTDPNGSRWWKFFKRSTTKCLPFAA